MTEDNGNHDDPKVQSDALKQPASKQPNDAEPLANGKLKSADLTISFLKVGAREDSMGSMTRAEVNVPQAPEG